MAKKEKNNEVIKDKKPKKNTKKQQKSRVWEVLSKEYRGENIALGIAAMLVVVLGIYLIEATSIVFDDRISFLFENQRFIGWLLVMLGASIVLALLYPIFKPSFQETSKITWPKKKLVSNNSIRVIIFIVILATIFVTFGILFDFLIKDVLKVVE